MEASTKTRVVPQMAHNGDSFVEVAEETLNTDSFVVAVRSSMEAEAEEGASIGEDSTKGTTGIGDNKATHTDFQKELLE